LNKKDLFGKALYDYWFDHSPEDIITWTNLTPQEILPVSYLFRDFDEMPVTEQKALKMCRGKILDVGAGSGSHSIWLQEQGQNITAIDFSAFGHKVMKDRGLKDVVLQNFFSYEKKKFDTILLLMNGVGIVGKAKYAHRLFQQLDKLLLPEGQALIHSSDLKYLYELEQGYRLPKGSYYGDLKFHISYKNETEYFDWTYLDEETLTAVGEQNGFFAEKIVTSEYGDFLMKMFRK